MTLLILECTPIRDRAPEGKILNQFLTLPDLDFIDVKYKEFRKKAELIKFLSKNKNIVDHEFVHLSGHGSVTKKYRAMFELSRGHLEACEFPDYCFLDQSLTLSACELGQKVWADTFLEQTGAIEVIGPKNEVSFTDACIFWINYYYLVLQDGLKPKTAFDHTKTFLKKRVEGKFKYWRCVE